MLNPRWMRLACRNALVSSRYQSPSETARPFSAQSGDERLGRLEAAGSLCDRDEVDDDVDADERLRDERPRPDRGGASDAPGGRPGPGRLTRALGAFDPDGRVHHAVGADRPTAVGAADGRLPPRMPVARPRLRLLRDGHVGAIVSAACKVTSRCACTSPSRPPRPSARPTAIVVDVLRATSTIAQALASGYRRVLCCAEVEEACELRARLGDAVLAGERKAVAHPGLRPGKLAARVHRAARRDARPDDDERDAGDPRRRGERGDRARRQPAQPGRGRAAARGRCRRRGRLRRRAGALHDRRRLLRRADRRAARRRALRRGRGGRPDRRARSQAPRKGSSASENPEHARLREDIAWCARESVLDVVPRLVRMEGAAAEIVAVGARAPSSSSPATCACTTIPALAEAVSRAESVVPLFVFDERIAAGPEPRPLPARLAGRPAAVAPRPRRDAGRPARGRRSPRRCRSSREAGAEAVFLSDDVSAYAQARRAATGGRARRGARRSPA